MNANTIVDALPEGYRWATADEAQRWTHPVYFNKMVQVRFAGTETDLAIKV